MKDTRKIKPWNAGLASEDTAVARRFTRLLAALGEEININIIEGGEVVDKIYDLSVYLRTTLRAEGWRFGSNGRILAPKEKR